MFAIYFPTLLCILLGIEVLNLKAWSSSEEKKTGNI